MKTDSIQVAGPGAPGAAVRRLPSMHTRLSALSSACLSMGPWLACIANGSQTSLLGSLLLGAVPLARRAVVRGRSDWVHALIVARYLAFIVPAAAVCLLSVRFGPQATAIGYGLAAASLALTTTCPKGQGNPPDEATRAPARIPCACVRLDMKHMT